MLAVAAVVRLALPMRLVMVYSAYVLAEGVAAFTAVPRSGATPFVLHRAIAAATGPDHRTMVTVHTVLGLATLPLLLAWLARLGPPRGTLALAAAGLALTPALALDPRTESWGIVGWFFLVAGILLLDAALRPRQALDLQSERTSLRRPRAWLDGVGALICLALAATSRPELTIVAPCAAAGLVALRRAGKLPWAACAVATLAFVALVAPHALHLLHAAAVEAAVGSLPALDLAFWLGAVPHLGTLALPLQPDLFPVAVTAIAVAGLALGDAGRAARAGMLGVALLWMVLTVVDLPRTSVPRLHAAPGALVVLAAAWAAAAAWVRPMPGPQALSQRKRQLFAFALGAAVVASAVPSALVLTARTNEDDTEDFVAAAFARLPERGACLQLADAETHAPADRTQRAIPKYLLRPPWRDVVLLAAAQPVPPTTGACAAGVYLLVDARCWAVHRDAAADVRRGPDGMLAACSHALAGHRWSAVLQWSVRSRGDNEYGYWPGAPTLHYGLYRRDVTAAAATSP
ncbi:MAG: hypothetical protein EXR79_04700 [Myxococcales bacterium]|nr:hypothetical protein [Myxococcales bacterium]